MSWGSWVWGNVKKKKFLQIIDSATYFLPSACNIIVLLILESSRSDGHGYCWRIGPTSLFFSHCAPPKSQSHLSLIPLLRLLSQLHLLLSKAQYLWESVEKAAATPVAAEQVYHCQRAVFWLVGPSSLECAAETIRCSRRVAACCGER